MSSTSDPYYNNTSASADYTGPKGPLWEWTARVHVDKAELGSATAVCLFLGEPPQDPKDWLIASNLAGAHHVLVSPGRSVGGYGYGSRRQAAGGRDIAEGFVHLNSAIARLSGLNSFDPKLVVPYLKEELEWRVQKADTTPIEVESLEIVVFATPLTYPPGGMFPVPGERRQYNTITYGKPGGSRDSEDL